MAEDPTVFVPVIDEPANTGEAVVMPKKRSEAPASQAPPPDAMSAVDAKSDGVLRIRDILFGSQMTEYEQRFQSLGASLDEAVDRLESVISDEGTARGKSFEELRQHHVKDAEELKQELSQWREESRKELETLRAELQAELRKVRQELDQSRAELLRAVEAKFGELSTAKADRTTLANLLTELAGSLSSAEIKATS